MQQGERTISTRDETLAAALLSMGIPPDPRCPFESVHPESGETRNQWHFSPVSDCGKFRTLELMAAWEQGPEFVSKNPEHPFSFLLAYLPNLALAKTVKRREPCYVIQRGKSFCLIDPRAPLTLTERILAKMNL